MGKCAGIPCKFGGKTSGYHPLSPLRFSALTEFGKAFFRLPGGGVLLLRPSGSMAFPDPFSELCCPAAES
jgi:hypothetical protein